MEMSNRKLPVMHFQRDLIWNLASTVILAVGGLLFSVLIALFYDPEVLGVFNQAYAYYILFAQFAVLGVHMATGKLTAEHHQDGDMPQRLLWTGILSVAVISLLCVLVIGAFLLLTGLIDRGDVWFATFLTLAALPMLSVNKVALSYLNGLSQMRAYAVLQGLRPVLIVGGILFCSLNGYPGKYLAGSFFAAELVLMILFFLYSAFRRIPLARPDRALAKELLRFGVSIFPGNLILEFNTKIDIICLGLFTGSNYLVGIYSFAALFAEGFYQLFVVVRRIINPRITQAYAEGQGLKERLKSIVSMFARYLRFGAPAAAALLVLVYYAACYLLKRESYIAAMVPLVILACSITINSKSICLGNTLSDIGKPSAESLVNIIAAASNFAFNCILIPLFGLIGAAVATGASYFVYMLVQRRLIQKNLGFTL
jgi:O-antigen/teichoic acid export membrane protein